MLTQDKSEQSTHTFIPHERFVTTQRDLMQAVARARPGEFIWLIGPSWSGKSELRRQLLPALGGDPMYWPCGHLPLVSVRAVLNQGDKFNPKDFALRLHQEITEPEVAWSSASAQVGEPDAAHDAAEARAASSVWQEVRARTPERVLRLSFERMSKVRGLKYIIIEEAANISRVGKNQSARNYMLGIMALIEEIGCCAIMIGTHEAASLFDDAQEILNRSDVLYMRPYSLKVESDVVAYASLVKAIGSWLPLSHKAVLQDNLDLIALNGGGVFGPTYRYLRKADAERCRAGGSVLTEEHLRSASGTVRNHTSLWSDIDAFNRLADAGRSISLEKFVGRVGPKRGSGVSNG